MTRDEINTELAEIIHIAKTADDKFVYGSVLFQPWYNENWEAVISGWGLRPELRASGDTIIDALNNLREAALELKSDEQRLAEILGVDHAKAA